jgi:Domain of unknown function (DUF4270)
MTLNNPFLKKLSIALVVIFFASCDKDYNTLGSDIVGNENFSFTNGESFDVKAYNQKVETIQTNNLPINQLGILNSPVFGITKANFVTQLTLANLKPTFLTNSIVIDSVILTVPYYSTKLSTDDKGWGKYRLDSIYGSDVPLNLKVYRNGYYLRDYDPLTNFLTSQKYYSNEDNLFSTNKIALSSGLPLNDSDNTIENSKFVFSEKEYVKFKVSTTIPDPKEVESRSSPRLRLHLNKAYFKTAIIDASADKLDNNNAFKEYFRGLYFEVENNTTGRMASIDFTKGDVTIYYKDATSTTVATIIQKTLVLNMTSSASPVNTVNLLENTDNPEYMTAVSSNAEASKLYIKGGQGSQAYIDLFSDLAKLQELKDKQVLINEATLTFTIDQSKMNANGTIPEPQRIYVYNAENNKVILDYKSDKTSNATVPKLGKFIYGGIIEKDVTKKGTQYKIRLTEHVKNIVNKDSVNVRLGIVVTENIGIISNYFLKTPIELATSPKKIIFDRLPATSILSPIGTVLYGSNPGSGDENKKIKFQIYYTKPN